MGTFLRVGGRTDAGRVRAKNEDAFIAADLTRSECSLSPRWSGLVDVGERGALVAVSDGMSAGRDGELASALVISSLAQGLARQAVEGEEGPASDAAAEAHESAWAGACSWGLEMGATLTALYLRGGFAYLAEIGDAHAYLIRDGRIVRLTKDRTCAPMLDRVAMADPDGLLALPFRDVILRATGHKPLAAAFCQLALRHGDLLFLCSDGLSGQVSDNEIRDAIVAASDALSAADQLIDLANQRGGADNATAVVARVTIDGPPAHILEPRRREPQPAPSYGGGL
jgi:serine/threonine protein phosphatase PrpC